MDLLPFALFIYLLNLNTAHLKLIKRALCLNGQKCFLWTTQRKTSHFIFVALDSGFTLTCNICPEGMWRRWTSHVTPSGTILYRCYPDGRGQISLDHSHFHTTHSIPVSAPPAWSSQPLLRIILQIKSRTNRTDYDLSFERCTCCFDLSLCQLAGFARYF